MHIKSISDVSFVGRKHGIEFKRQPRTGKSLWPTKMRERNPGGMKQEINLRVYWPESWQNTSLLIGCLHVLGCIWTTPFASGYWTINKTPLFVWEPWEWTWSGRMNIYFYRTLKQVIQSLSIILKCIFGTNFSKITLICIHKLLDVLWCTVKYDIPLNTPILA